MNPAILEVASAAVSGLVALGSGFGIILLLLR